MCLHDVNAWITIKLRKNPFAVIFHLPNVILIELLYNTRWKNSDGKVSSRPQEDIFVAASTQNWTDEQGSET